MEFSLTYLLYRGLQRFLMFWKHWYGDGTRYAVWRLRSSIYSLDRTFAVRVTVRHFFEPLWGDYSPVGRIIGPIFRALRVLIGGVAYLIIAAVWLVLLLTWYAIPPFLIIQAIINSR